MDVEEVRKRKGEAEEAIKNIVLTFIKDTSMEVTEIEIKRQYIDEKISSHIITIDYGPITDIKMDVKL